jgi:hypothetical protein
LHPFKKLLVGQEENDPDTLFKHDLSMSVTYLFVILPKLLIILASRRGFEPLLSP